MDMDKPPVDPTTEEWDSVIIPGVRRYLQTENHPLYEIDVRGFYFCSSSPLPRSGYGVYVITLSEAAAKLLRWI